MKKDIEFLVAKDVYVAITHDWIGEDFLAKEYNAYLINNRNTPIEMVLIVSKGYTTNQKTSTMRHAIGVVPAKGFEKIEMVQEEVLSLTNEFFVTFYVGRELYERKFVFEKNTVTSKNFTHIPILGKEGILAK